LLQERAVVHSQSGLGFVAGVAVATVCGVAGPREPEPMLHDAAVPWCCACLPGPRSHLACLSCLAWPLVLVDVVVTLT
jgi:hypothetical protein